MEEVAAAAAGGELGGYTTGAVFTNMMSLCRDLADYRRGIEWSDAAIRWPERQRIEGFPGICRDPPGEPPAHAGRPPRRPGAKRAARARRPREFSLVHAGAAQHELGEVRLRLGDLDGAEDAFRPRAASSARTRSPASRCCVSRRATATRPSRRSGRSLEGAAFDGFARARMLSGAGRDRRRRLRRRAGREARDGLAELADQIPSPAVARGERVGGGLARAPGGRSRDRAPGHLARGPESMERRSAPVRVREGGGSRSPRRSSLRGDEAAAAELARLAPRSSGSGRTAMLREPPSSRERAPDETARRPGPSGRSCSRTSSARPRCSSVIGDDAWDDLRRWHDQTLRASFADHGGEEIDHAGDGFFVAFPDAARGPRLAVADPTPARRASTRSRVRAPGPDGPARHRRDPRRDRLHGPRRAHGRRISALAGAGEILASAETLGGRCRRADVSERRIVTAEGHRRAGRRGLDRLAPSD